MAFYFDINYAIKEHDFIIENSGGLNGIKDEGLLDSFLSHIKNDDYYPTIEDKACYLFYSFNKNHVFNDGNKRTSIGLTAFFLEINGFEHKVDYFINEMENISVCVADNRIERELLFEIIKSIIYEPYFEEDLQLKIIEAIINSDIDTYETDEY